MINREELRQSVWNSELTKTEKLVLLALIDNVQNQGDPISMFALANLCSCTRQCISRMLNSLESKGVIKRESNKAGRMENRYWIQEENLL